MNSYDKPHENSEDFIEFLLKNSKCKKAPDTLGLKTLCLFDKDKSTKKKLKRILIIAVVALVIAAFAVISYIGFDFYNMLESLFSGQFTVVVSGTALGAIGFVTFGILFNRLFGMRKLVSGITDSEVH